MKIPAWPQADEREAELLRQVLESPQWGGFHPYVAEFERSFAAYQHCAFGISASNGTITLELALEVLGIGPGDEVIVPAISFVSTATAVSRRGATPVFVDIEPWSFNIDPNRIEEAIGPNTRAIIPVHFGGTMCNIEAVEQICRQHGLPMIEDAAHAHGSEWKGKRAGSFGVAGSFSFQNGKVLCSGEGGMLVSSDEAFAIGSRSIANQGRKAGRSFYEHYRLGTNFRLTGFQAAVLIAQFERLPEQIGRRTEAARYIRALDLPGIVWQPEPPAMTQNSQYLLCGRIHNGHRDEFHAKLTEKGIPCTAFYPHTLYQNPLYREPGTCRVMPCPNAEAYLKDAFWFPHRLLLSDEETLGEIAKELTDFGGLLGPA